MMSAVDSQSKSTLVSLRSVFAPVEDSMYVQHGRRVVTALVILLPLLGITPPAHAGFIPHRPEIQHSVWPPGAWLLRSEDNSEESDNTADMWLDSNAGAGAWNGDEADNDQSVPGWPNSPLSPFSIAPAATAGLAAGASTRNLTAPPGSAGGNASPAGLCAADVQLPIPLLKYHLQKHESLLIPDAPPFELFHPS